MNKHASLARAQQAATRVDPVTAAVIHGALENIAIEMGYKLMRMTYSSIIRESEDFGAALTMRKGGSCANARVDPAAVGPDPRLHPRHPPALKSRGQTAAARRRHHAQRPLLRRVATVRTSPSACRSSTTDELDRLFGHDGAPPRHRRAHAGQLRHRRCVGRLRRGPAVQGDQGRHDRACATRRSGRCCATTSAPPTLVVGDMDAQVAAGRIGAARYLDLVERYGLDTVNAACEDLMDYSERLMRDADRDSCRTATTRADDPYRRLPRRSDDPARRDLPIVVTVTVAATTSTVDLTGTAPQVAGHADQHAVRRHGRRRDLADAPLDPARQRRSTATSRRTPA